MLDASIGGKPEPKVFWSKGDKELDLCEKINLQYTSKRALAIVKFCDRSDTGKYTLTVKNASGTKSVSVLVKVLGKHAYRMFYLVFIRVSIIKINVLTFIYILLFRLTWSMCRKDHCQ